MPYIRKTRDLYFIIWRMPGTSLSSSETIDTAETREEAKKLLKEYKIAFHYEGSFWIRRGRERINN